MALFRVQVRKAFIGSAQAFKWSNIWYVNAGDVLAAANTGIGYWNRLRQCHSLQAYAYEVYASDLLPNTSNFVTIPVPASVAAGTLPVLGELYHPSITIRVDLGVLNSRPSRKFIRPPLFEGDVVNGNTATQAITDLVADSFADILALGAQAPLDESGNAFTGAIVEGITSKRLGRDARNDVPPVPGS